jgi:hypothetical protein
MQPMSVDARRVLGFSLDDQLEENEEVVFAARPGPGESLGHARRLARIQLVFGLPLLGVSLLWVAMALSPSSNEAPAWDIRLFVASFALPFATMGLFMVRSPWRVESFFRDVAARTAYVVTNRRVLIVDAGFVGLGTALSWSAAMGPLTRVWGCAELRLPKQPRVRVFEADALADVRRTLRMGDVGDLVFRTEDLPRSRGGFGIGAVAVGFVATPHLSYAEDALRALGAQVRDA